jgi:hypothetical protein
MPGARAFLATVSAIRLPRLASDRGGRGARGVSDRGLGVSQRLPSPGGTPLTDEAGPILLGPCRGRTGTRGCCWQRSDRSSRLRAAPYPAQLTQKPSETVTAMRRPSAVRGYERGSVTARRVIAVTFARATEYRPTRSGALRWARGRGGPSQTRSSLPRPLRLGAAGFRPRRVGPGRRRRTRWRSLPPLATPRTARVRCH